MTLLTSGKIETQTGTANINGFGTAHWVEPGLPMMDAIFGQGAKDWQKWIDWCVETFDKSKWDISTNYNNRIMFRDKADRTLFMLKWC